MTKPPKPQSRQWASFGRSGVGSSGEYYRCAYSSVLGVGIFRKRDNQLIVTVILPKHQSEPLADKIIKLLQSEQP